MSDTERRSLFSAARAGLEPSPEDKARNAAVLAAKLGIAVGGAAASVSASKAGSVAAKTATTATATKAAVGATVISAKSVLGFKVLGVLVLVLGGAAVGTRVFSPGTSGLAQTAPPTSATHALAAPQTAPPASVTPALAAPQTALGSAESGRGSSPSAPLKAPLGEPPSATIDVPANDGPRELSPRDAVAARATVAPPGASPPSAGDVPAEGPARVARGSASSRSGGAPSGGPSRSGVGSSPDEGDPPAGVVKPAVVPSAAASASPLTAELVLVRAMHTALAHHDYAHATTLADEHARRFPGGVLALEVEGLRVLAQCQSAPSAAARQLAVDFVRRHPRAPMVDRVRATCGVDAP